MHDEHRGLDIATRIISVFYSVITFIFGITVAIKACTQYYYEYDEIYNEEYVIKSFNQSGFAIAMVVILIFMALPITITIFSFLFNRNKNLITPAFVLAVVLLPGVNFGTLYGTILAFSNYLGITNPAAITFCIFYLIASIVLFILLLISVIKRIPSSPCLSEEKPVSVFPKVEEKTQEKDFNKSYETIMKAKELYDAGVLTQEEFSEIKARQLK